MFVCVCGEVGEGNYVNNGVGRRVVGSPSPGRSRRGARDRQEKRLGTRFHNAPRTHRSFTPTIHLLLIENKKSSAYF